MIESKKDKRQKVRYKIRKRISGSKDIPRLAILGVIKKYMLN